MAISKRTRWDVLRRDRFTCQYCGKSAPDVVLMVDHVEPRSHGGGDESWNLLTSCEDCNLGKGATAPGQWLILAARNHENASRRNSYVPWGNDLTSMYQYMEAWGALAALPADQVLDCVVHVLAEAFPVRPYAAELIIAAANLAKKGYGAGREAAPF